ncbi:MAG: alpha/beta hydrolase [Candidatus Ozemobacteraceae bacterium]
MIRNLLRRSAFLCTVVALIAFLVYLFQERLIFFPMKLDAPLEIKSPPDRVIEHVTFQAADGTQLSGIWLGSAGQATTTEKIVASGTPESSPNQASRPVLLYSHGNGGNLGHRLGRLLEGFSQLPIDVFLYDYRGYGLSSGSPTVAGVISDAEGAAKWLREVKGIPSEQLILYGESLGTGVAVSLAKQLSWKVKAIVLESGFRSLSARSGEKIPFIGPFVLRGDLPSETLLREYSGPYFVIHSKGDGVNSFLHGEALYSASPSTKKRKLTFEAWGHNDPVWQDPTYIPAWKEFLASLP